VRRVLEGHTDYVTCGLVEEFGASARWHYDRTIRVWKWEGRRVKILKDILILWYIKFGRICCAVDLLTRPSGLWIQSGNLWRYLKDTLVWMVWECGTSPYSSSVTPQSEHGMRRRMYFCYQRKHRYVNWLEVWNDFCGSGFCDRTIRVWNERGDCWRYSKNTWHCVRLTVWTDVLLQWLCWQHHQTMDFRLELVKIYWRTRSLLRWAVWQRVTISSSMEKYSGHIEFGIGQRRDFFQLPGNTQMQYRVWECGRPLSVLSYNASTSRLWNLNISTLTKLENVNSLTCSCDDPGQSSLISLAMCWQFRTSLFSITPFNPNSQRSWRVTADMYKKFGQLIEM